jgi:aminobenzoyl-glutamate utilization protein B
MATDKGSSDVGNVSWIVPTASLYTYYCDAPAHSLEWVEKGTSREAESAILNGIKILALTASTYIADPEKIKAVKEEHLSALRMEE